MKKSLLALLSAAAFLMASEDGYEVYKNSCASCHVEMISVAELKKNLSKLKAPPMVEVANRIKSNIVIADDDEDVHRRVVTLFISEYAQNPQLEHTMCDPMAVERFGVMPSLKEKLTKAQREAVAEWMYDRYEGVAFE